MIVYILCNQYLVLVSLFGPNVGITSQSVMTMGAFTLHSVQDTLSFEGKICSFSLTQEIHKKMNIKKA
jgi:hypothetical protein